MTRENYIKAIEAVVKGINAFENAMNTACELSGVANVQEWPNADEVIRAITEEYMGTNDFEESHWHYLATNLEEAYNLLEFEGIEC